jgi:hypothetical protein
MEELNVGDWLYVPDMGAYTTATSTEFNGFPKPEIFLAEEPYNIRKKDVDHLVPRGVSYMAPLNVGTFWGKN